MAFCTGCGRRNEECECADRSRSRERQAKENAQDEDVCALLKTFMKTQANDNSETRKLIEGNAAKVTSEIRTLGNEMKQVKKDMCDLDNKFSKRVGDHEERLKVLEGKVSAGGGSGGGGSGGGGTGGRSAGAAFVPHHLEVKGFCTFEDRASKGATG